MQEAPRSGIVMLVGAVSGMMYIVGRIVPHLVLHPANTSWIELVRNLFPGNHYALV